MTDILEYADRAWTGEAPLTAYHTFALRGEGLHRILDDVYMSPSFGNVYLFRTDAGLFMFDTGDRSTADELFARTRELTDAPLVTAVYSHGHIDHVFGLGPFDAEAAADGAVERGLVRPTVIAQENVRVRFDRYRAMAGHNSVINQRQFQAPDYRWPADYRAPDITYGDRTVVTVGELTVELHHAMGETDDATIAWIPDRKVLCCGDLFIWASPNAGNPQKVQRYPREWADALRWMAGLGAEYLLPGHGLPIVGADRVRTTLLDAAEFLDSLRRQTVALMNRGADLDEVLASVTIRRACSTSRTCVRCTTAIRPTWSLPRVPRRHSRGPSSTARTPRRRFGARPQAASSSPSDGRAHRAPLPFAGVGPDACPVGPRRRRVRTRPTPAIGWWCADRRRT